MVMFMTYSQYDNIKPLINHSKYYDNWFSSLVLLTTCNFMCQHTVLCQSFVSHFMRVGRKGIDSSQNNVFNHSKMRPVDGYWCGEAKRCQYFSADMPISPHNTRVYDCRRASQNRPKSMMSSNSIVAVIPIIWTYPAWQYWLSYSRQGLHELWCYLILFSARYMTSLFGHKLWKSA